MTRKPKTIWVARCDRCDEDVFRHEDPKNVYHYCDLCGHPVDDNQFKLEEVADITKEALGGAPMTEREDVKTKDRDGEKPGES